jgi:hypothetical protein
MGSEEYSERDLEIIQIYRASTDPVVPHDLLKHGGPTILSREEVVTERIERIAQRKQSEPIEKACWAETTAAAQPLTGNANCVNMPLFFGTFIEISKRYIGTKGDPDALLPDHAFEVPVPTSLDPNADSPQGYEAINPHTDSAEESVLFDFTETHQKAATELRCNIKHYRDLAFLSQYEHHMTHLKGLGLDLDVPKRTWTEAALAIQNKVAGESCLNLMENELLGPLVDTDSISKSSESVDGQTGLDMF